MKKFILNALLIVVAFGITGCGGSIYNYNVTPTPIQQGTSKYVINDISLELTHGHGHNINNKTFKTEDQLKKSFKIFLNKELEKQSLLGNKNSYKLNIDINYMRKYNYGGNALNKPEFDYTVSVYNSNEKLLATFSIPRSTTKYGYFKDMAVNLEIGIFKWDAEDEPQDIELISKTLITELSELGK